jgi:Flp pilus assembly protein TadD
MRAWPRAISDFDRALILRPNDVEILVLRAAAWRNARNPTRALDDAAHALRIAPDHSEALLERGFASLVLGERNQANNDFNKVLRLVPPDSAAARRAQAGLRGEQPVPPPAETAPPAPATPKGGGKR